MHVNVISCITCNASGTWLCLSIYLCVSTYVIDKLSISNQAVSKTKCEEILIHMLLVCAGLHVSVFLLVNVSVWPVSDPGLTLGLVSSHRWIGLRAILGPEDIMWSAAPLKDYSAQQESAFKRVSIMLETAREREEVREKKERTWERGI